MLLVGHLAYMISSLSFANSKLMYIIVHITKNISNEVIDVGQIE